MENELGLCLEMPLISVMEAHSLKSMFFSTHLIWAERTKLQGR